MVFELKCLRTFNFTLSRQLQYQPWCMVHGPRYNDRYVLTNTIVKLISLRPFDLFGLLLMEKCSQDLFNMETLHDTPYKKLQTISYE
nr:hypothetical protein Itr_chr02CG23240 [Ipomoea trifida]